MKNMNQASVRTLKSRRRGGGIAVVLILLAVVNLAVIGAIRASGDEAQVGAMRAETSRAFFAAESGARVVLKCSTAGLTLPTAGTSLTLAPATCTYVSMPLLGQPGDAILQGQDGTAARRVKVTVSSPFAGL